MTNVIKLPIAQPKTRGDCVNGPRPCPHAECRYHLQRAGDAKGMRWDAQLARMRERAALGNLETCALDIADRGGASLEDIANYMGMTRERVRQITETAARKVRVCLPRDMRRPFGASRVASEASEVTSVRLSIASLDAAAERLLRAHAEPPDAPDEDAAEPAPEDADADAVFCDRVWIAYEKACLRREAEGPTDRELDAIEADPEVPVPAHSGVFGSAAEESLADVTKVVGDR